MDSTRELLITAAGTLRAAGVPTPEVDAELLLAHVTGRQRGLLRLAGSSASHEQSAHFRALVAQRAQRIPLQHITGLAPFRHLELRVGPGVFIPRPETELIVDHVLDFIRAERAAGARAAGTANAEDPNAPSATPRGGGRGMLVVDLCAGSAALALAIAMEAPGSRVLAVELAPEALDWAGRNVAQQATALAQVGSTLELVAADATVVAAPGGALERLRGLVDVVVTNPPYVPDGALPREVEVREHDPAQALYGGPDGLDVVRPLAAQAAQLLRAGGLLVIEHADVQGEDAGASGVPAILRAQHLPGGPTQSQAGCAPDPSPRSTVAAQPAWQDVTDHLDLAGRPRHTSAHRAPVRSLP